MSDDAATTTFGLIRHAETVWNREKRIQGQTDAPLTPEGEKQAGKWGRLLKSFHWNRIISSDTGRAKKTADLINASLKIPASYDHRLREQHWGEWEGESITRIQEEIPRVLPEAVSGGWEFCPPGGESRRAVWERSQRVIREAARNRPGEKILIVTHEGVIKCLVYTLCGRWFLPTEDPLLHPQHLHWLIHGRVGLRIGEVNAVSLGSDF